MVVGPPGAGKSMAARRLPSLLPPLRHEEAIEVRQDRRRRRDLPAARRDRPRGRSGRRTTRSRRPAWSAAAIRSARERSPSPTGGSSSWTSWRSSAGGAGGAASAARGGARDDRPGGRAHSASRPASSSSPQPTPAPAGTAQRTRAAGALPGASTATARLSGALADRIDISVSGRSARRGRARGGRAGALGSASASGWSRRARCRRPGTARG